MSNWVERWPSFTPEEILSPAQLHLYETKHVFPYSFRSLDKLQEFRNLINMPLFINHGNKKLRGARSLYEAYKTNVGTRGFVKGWDYSFHLWCAFDISTEDSSPAATAILFEKVINFGKFHGVGHYDTFVHIDDRDTFDDRIVVWDLRNL